MPASTVSLRPLFFLGASALLTACMGAANQPPQPAATPAPAVQEAVVTEEPQAPPPSPDRLDGLTPAEVLSLMGEPGLVRRDGKVQVMLFETDACVLELVFLEPTPDDHFRMEHRAARDRQGNDMDQIACLTHILPEGTWPD